MIKTTSALATAVGPALVDDPFTLIDVGCMRGIAPGWRAFEPNLVGVGFDPKIAECERLTSIETNTRLRYVPAYVDIPPDHPMVVKRGGGPAPRERNFWHRMSCARTLKNQTGEAKPAQPTGLADREKPIHLSAYLQEEGFDTVDFIKIDVDGLDYDILVSVEEDLARRHVLGAGVEVPFWGTGSDTVHGFHNVDRFMRTQGFELFGLTIHRYSAAALPDRYKTDRPNEAEMGRPRFGDALYLRDLAADEHRALGVSYGPHKLLKLSALFHLFQLPDCAAELIVEFRDEIAKAGVEPDALLGLLTRERCEKLGLPELSYEDYLARFDADGDVFYGRPRQRP